MEVSAGKGSRHPAMEYFEVRCNATISILEYFCTVTQIRQKLFQNPTKMAGLWAAHMFFHRFSSVEIQPSILTIIYRHIRDVNRCFARSILMDILGTWYQEYQEDPSTHASPRRFFSRGYLYSLGWSPTLHWVASQVEPSALKNSYRKSNEIWVVCPNGSRFTMDFNRTFFTQYVAQWNFLAYSRINIR